MGCSSSSLKYRDIYEQLQKHLQLTEEVGKNKAPTNAVIAARSNVFYNICESNEPLEKEATEDDPYILDPDEATLSELMKFAEQKWGITKLHPIFPFLCVECARLIAYCRDPEDPASKSFPESLPRWNFHLWLVALCQYFHVLAILQETKTMPSALKTWLKRLEKPSKDQPRIKASDFTGKGQLSDAAKATITSCFAIPMTTKDLKPKLTAQLVKELQQFLPCTNTALGGPVVNDPAVLMLVSSRFWTDLSQGNPLLAVNATPFMGFVEWTVLRQVMSVMREEEDPDTYRTPLPQLFAYEECLPTLYDHEECLPTLREYEECSPRFRDDEEFPDVPSEADEGGRVVDGSDGAGAALGGGAGGTGSSGAGAETGGGAGAGAGAGAGTGAGGAGEKADGLSGGAEDDSKYEDIAKWRALLNRLTALEKDLETSNDENRSELETERDAIKDKIRVLFARLSHNTNSLSAESACDEVYTNFKIDNTIPNKEVHDNLSNQAFQHALANNTETTLMNEEEEFRQYMDLYIILHDLYNTAITEQGGNIGEEVLPMDFDVFKRVIDSMDNQYPDLFPFPGHNDRNARIMAMRAFFDSLAITSSENPDGVVLFDDLCDAVAKLSKRRGMVDADNNDLRSLEELRAILGLHEEGHPDVFVELLRPAFGECRTVSEETLSTFRSVVRKNIQLSHFTFSALFATELAAQFSAIAVSDTDSSEDASLLLNVMKKWLQKLRQCVENRNGGDIPRLTEFLAHAIFCATAVARTFEDMSSDEKRFLGFSKSDLVGRDWFCRAIPQCGQVLGLTSEELMRDARFMLDHRPNIISVNRRTSMVAKKASLRSAQSCEDDLFRAFTLVDQGTDKEATYVADVAYVCLLNYLRSHFEYDPTFAAFFERLCPLTGVKAMRKMLSFMPLDDDFELYRQFFEFSKGRRVVYFGSDDHSAADEFVDAMFEHYREYIVPSRAVFAQWCDAAAAHICGDDNNKNLGLDVRKYLRFLEYIAGECIAYAVYESDRKRVQNTLASEVAGEFVKRAFVEDLLRFLSDSEEDVAARAEEVLDKLLDKDLDTHDGFISLETAASWYAEERVLRVKPTAMELWLEAAARLPYTCSLDHRRTRHAMNNEIKEEKYTLGLLPDGIDDGYHPSNLLVKRIAEQFKLHDLPFIPLNSESPDVEEWILQCVSRTNEAANRTDLGDNEINANDLRFVFQFIHHEMFTHMWNVEAAKEFVAMNQAVDRNAEHVFCYDHAFFSETYEYVLDALDSGKQCKADLLSVFNTNTAVDSVYVAQTTSSTLVQRSRRILGRSQEEYQEENESKLLDDYEHEMLLGRNPQNDATAGFYKSHPVSYWERLRYHLPHGDSLRQRTRRQTLFKKMDNRGKGYLTLADLNVGLRDIARLGEFRADFMPVVFRAFFATIEVASAKEDVIYVTSSQEQFITPRHFCAFLKYLYLYMELYYMFDVLTCSTHLDEDLHVMPDACDPFLHERVAAQVVDLHHSLNEAKAQMLVFTPAAALFAAAASPYTLALEATGVKKEVTLPQFEVAHYLLRHWGVHVDKADEVFRDINRRTREKGKMHFVGFAVWASLNGMRPEGCKHGYDELNDELARVEMGILAVGE